MMDVDKRRECHLVTFSGWSFAGDETKRMQNITNYSIEYKRTQNVKIHRIE